MTQQPHLVRALSVVDASALVVGTVIGTGVFLKAAPMAQAVGSPMWVLLAWVAAGLLSLAGALTYAELSAMMPEAGGEYVYLRKAYGETTAFVFGWQRFIVAGSASIASLGVGFSIFLSTVIPLEQVWIERNFELLGESIRWQFGLKQVVAVSVILALTCVNCFSVAFGGKVHVILTLLKISGIAFIVFGIFTFSQGTTWSNLATPNNSHWNGLSAFGTAMLAALWGYDGWNNMPMAAGEVRDPGRNIPRALIFGMLAVIIIYCALNLSYFYALPFEQVATSNSTLYRDALPVAAVASQTFLGEYGSRIVAIVFMVSALGALNGSILSNARVPFAMARDRLFFRRMGLLNQSSRVPVVCLIVQGLWASLLALSGTFDQLTDCLLFASWIFYALVTSSVFVLRKNFPEMDRPHRTWGYPLVPFTFVVVAVWLIINTLFSKPVESVAGLVLMAAGLPLYWFYRRRNHFEREALRE
ncbi:MAG: amino acid permease [Planctomycetota bacterium]|nr:amino acid permease [Planctomycetota bacterium]